MGLTADPNIQGCPARCSFPRHGPGLHLIQPRVVVDSLRGIEVRDIIQDRSRNFWFATNQGVWRARTRP